MSEFHHPYNFIPATGKINGKDDQNVEYEQIKKGKSKHIRHDRWQEDTHSGRLIARVHLKTPTVVGGQQTKPEAEKGAEVSAIIKPFERDDIAIPANSLRGMVGAVAETLSQSALRVLHKKRYSVRKPVNEGLSAIGMFRVDKNDPNQFHILPLTIPQNLTSLWLQVFDADKPLKNHFVAQVNGYEYDKRQHALYLQNKSFLKNNPNLKSFYKDAVSYFYARLPDENNKPIEFFNRKLLISQQYSDLITKAEYQKKPPEEQAKYTRGLLRILGIEGRETEMPPTKKHEFFIPFPEKYTFPTRLNVPSHVLDNFKTLAEERRAATAEDDKCLLPFLPQGYPVPDDYKDWKPEDGQLVFFDITRNAEDEIEVSEISFSAIWRHLVDKDSHQFFGKINLNLLPWSPERKSEKLTPAECLFGVIENIENKQKREQDTIARALASRVRFYDGQAVKTVEVGKEVILKILSSPKPPSPAMYFHRGKTQKDYVSKAELNQADINPNGRKVYLHHQETDVKTKPWVTKHNDENLAQKVRCQPMQAGQSFYFHIDFDNLTTDELNLLIRSLYPSAEFQHRLGLGKPLGLGSVKVDIMGLFLVDRKTRYQLEGFYNSSRYYKVLKGTDIDSEWQSLYSEEYAALASATDEIANHAYFELGRLIDKTTLSLLQTVGNPAQLKPNTPVSPPITKQQTDVEHETFQWFVENDRTDKGAPPKQALGEIKAGQTLPTLKQN